MIVGYARVSTTDQTLALQQDALQAAGCGRIFADTISGATDSRPGLDEALAYLRPGDVLAVSCLALTCPTPGGNSMWQEMKGRPGWR